MNPRTEKVSVTYTGANDTGTMVWDELLDILTIRPSETASTRKSKQKAHGWKQTIQMCWHKGAAMFILYIPSNEYY